MELQPGFSLKGNYGLDQARILIDALFKAV